MKHFLVVSAAVVLLAQASAMSAQAATVTVVGQFVGGNSVAATCTVGANGQFSGSGVLSGPNGSGGVFKYAFNITKGVTANGKLILSGQVVGGPVITLSATSPSGAVVFTYIVNGNTYSFVGNGSISIK